MFEKFLKFRKMVLFFLLFSPFLVKAQYTQILAGPNITPVVNYIYVGSLTMFPNDAGNCQKMKVSVFGGSWYANSIGETIYYIANRSGLSVNQVVTGGIGCPATLRAFQNGANTDFYLQINSSTGYYAFAISSYLMAGITAPGQNVNITTSINTPVGTDITPTVNYIPVMITDASGNMGIGTVDPRGFKLAVKGTVHAQQVNVDLNNWADYVFDKAYHLPSLTDVKTYIDQNHHLPEIPSAEQVEKDGLNLGEMNKLLLKKVEELTLYLIKKDQQLKEQETKNNEQQADINDLKKQMALLMKQLYK